MQWAHDLYQKCHKREPNVTPKCHKRDQTKFASKEILTIEFHTKYMKLFVNMLFVICVLLNTKFHNTSENFYFEVIWSRTIVSSRGGSHIWNGYGCKARAPTGWGIRWEHRLKKWGVIGWEHDFWHPVREKSKNMRSYWSKNEGSLGESTIFFIRWVKFGIRWEKNIKIYGVFGWEHMRL